MMTLPRSQLICPASTSYYHCIGRCVRRAFLCGEDVVTGKDYSHRKGWVLARLALLAEVFTIELYAYAVMSNHYHLVLEINQDKALSLTSHEVISRWSRLFRVPEVVERWQNGNVQEGEDELVDRLIALWRQRLADVSWYMRCLNEYIAREANREDGCKGRFWEGRFKSQAILGKEGLMASMIYVDLNPLRAGLVSTPEESADVSLHQRLEEYQRLTETSGTVVEPEANHPWLLPFATAQTEPMSLLCTFTDYLQLLDWTGRVRRADKPGAIAADVPSIISRLGIDSRSFLSQLATKQLSRGTVIGLVTAAAEHAKLTHRQNVRGSLLRPSLLP
ncbi:MAG: transposase [Aeromonadaceae bacterium]